MFDAAIESDVDSFLSGASDPRARLESCDVEPWLAQRIDERCAPPVDRALHAGVLGSRLFLLLVPV